MLVRLFKWFELSWGSRCEIKNWMHSSTARDGFSAESFDNPSLTVATVKNADGKSVVYAAIEPCYLLSAYMCNPDSTGEEQKEAGDALDDALARKACAEGRSKLLMLLPDSCPSMPDERWVRIIERDVPLAVSVYEARQATAQRNFVN